MKKTGQLMTLGLALLMLGGCASTPQIAPTQAATEVILPTETLQPTATLEPTPLPGEMVLPLESLQFGSPWLPLNRAKLPTVVYYGFNVSQPPFNIPEVRQAFTLALDSEILAIMYEKSTFYNDVVAARTMIPAGTLSRDVSGVIGLPYDPARARELLSSVGYSDPTTFPETKMLITYFRWADYPGLDVNAATEAIRMWQENLGVTVTLEVVALEGDLLQQQRDLILSGQYQIYEYAAWVNNNDPDDFVSGMFGVGGFNNMSGFDSARVTALIRAGAAEVDPAKRLPIYLELERLLSEEELPIIPIFHCTVDASNW